MTLSRVTLESFEPEGAAEPRQSAEFQRGFEAGIAHAQTGHIAGQQKALSEIALRLNDMTFGYAEARLHLLDQIRPLLAQVAETVLPDVLNATFTQHLADILAGSFDEATQAPVEIGVAPEMVADLQAGMGETKTSFTFVADNEMKAGQAVLKRGETHLMIDFPALLDALQAALLGLEHSERTATHG